MEYYFRTKQLCVGYHKQPLIKDIELSLHKGEILTLIGPNGAGKSTILRSITRQLQLLHGVIYIDKQDITALSGRELAKKMSVVMTQKLQTELMTCEDVVATGRYPYTGRFGILSKEDERIVEQAMEEVHILALRNQEFTKISDGQRQRVMLARAICQEPEIIVMDEPTSFLDIKYKLDFLSILQRMKREKGLTVLMSLHELELAARVSDQILCVKGEYADRFGTPEEIFTQGYLTQLFDIATGSFAEESQSLELAQPQGEAEIFVIAGNGEGRNVFHRLQREGKAFCTGVIYPNDLDYPAATALAASVIEAKPFEPMTEQEYEQAKACMDKCKQVICTRTEFGSMETVNARLLAYAKKCGKVG